MPLLLAPRDTVCNTPARRSGAHRAFRLAGAQVSVCLLVRARALVDVNMRVSARLLPACTWMHMDALPWFEATLHAMPCGSRSLAAAGHCDGSCDSRRESERESKLRATQLAAKLTRRVAYRPYVLRVTGMEEVDAWCGLLSEGPKARPRRCVCVLVRAHVPTHVLSGSLATTHSLQTLSSSLALWRACSQPGLPGFRFDMNV